MGSTADQTRVPPMDGATTASVGTREIHKNGWLKRIPSRDRRSAPFVKPPKPEKMWVVFCIHDDINAFLEYYENRRSAFAHQPTSSIALSNCLHIFPNIVFQDNDFVFSITLDGRVVKLAASTREQMSEWIDALKSKLTDIGVLNPRYNLYTKAPEMRSSLAANRDPNSPLPLPPLASSNSISSSIGTATLTTSRAPLIPPHRTHHSEPSSPTSLSSSVVSLVSNRQQTTTTAQLQSASISLPSTPTFPLPQTLSRIPLMATPPSLAASREESEWSGTGAAAAASSSLFSVPSIPPPPPPLPGTIHFNFDATVAVQSTTSITAASSASYNNINNNNQNNRNNNPNNNGNVVRSASASQSINSNANSNPVEVLRVTGSNDNEHMSTFASSSVSTDHSTVYEPLFLATSSARTALSGIRNPSYFNPPSSNASAVASASEEGNSRTRSRASSEERPVRRSQPVIANGNINLLLSETLDIGIDENRRPLTLREKQVLILCREINNRGGVRLLLPRKDCNNTIAFVEFLGTVWIAGWKQREHPILYHSFHIGDRVLKVGRYEVQSVSEVQKIIRNEAGLKIEFIVARVPYGQVYALKREREGQDLGIVRDGNTAEVENFVDFEPCFNVKVVYDQFYCTKQIVEVVMGGLAARSGLPEKALSCGGMGPCNWVLTEINDRPLNLFFKENEVQDRLNAVGKDISILVQPSDFVKAMKKYLKSMRNYKDYIVQ